MNFKFSESKRAKMNPTMTIFPFPGLCLLVSRTSTIIYGFSLILKRPGSDHVFRALLAANGSSQSMAANGSSQSMGSNSNPVSVLHYYYYCCISILHLILPCLRLFSTKHCRLVL